MKKAIASLLLLVLAGLQGELFGGKNGKKKRKKRQDHVQIKKDKTEQAKNKLPHISINDVHLSIPQLSLHSKEELTKAFMGLYAHIASLHPTQEMEQPLHHLTLVFDELIKKNGNNEQKTKSELCGYADNIRPEIYQLQQYFEYKGNLEQVTNPELVRTGILSGYTSPWKYYIYEIMKAKMGLIKGCNNEIEERERKLKELKDEVRYVSTQISLYQGAKESHEQGFNSLKEYSECLANLLESSLDDYDSEVESYSHVVAGVNELLSDLRKNDPSSDSFEQEKKKYDNQISEADRKTAIAQQKRKETEKALKHVLYFIPKADKEGSYARTFGLV